MPDGQVLRSGFWRQIGMDIAAVFALNQGQHKRLVVPEQLVVRFIDTF